MAIIEVPMDFENPYKQFERYPKNLVHEKAFPLALKAYPQRLANYSPSMFTKSDDDSEASFESLTLIKMVELSWPTMTLFWLSKLSVNAMFLIVWLGLFFRFGGLWSSKFAWFSRNRCVGLQARGTS